MSTTEEQLRQYIQEQEGKAQDLKPNIVGTTQTTYGTQVTPETTSTVTNDAPTKTSSASSYTEYTEPIKQEAQQKYDESMVHQGYTKNAKGQWVINDSSLGSVLDMKKHNEEVERINRAKALNAGLLNAFTTIGDMISAGVGGNVYKREKNTIAEDAAKDTKARRDAIVQAEAAAKAKDKEDLMKALASAQAAHDKYLELNGIKKSTQTQDAYQESRTTTNSGGKTTTSSSTTKSPDRVLTTPIVVTNADGTSSTLYVNKAKAESYRTTAWNALMRINLADNTALAKYAEQAGYATENGTWKPSLKDVILNDTNIIAALPESIQKANRELRYDSEEYAGLIYGDDYRRLSKAEKAKRLQEVEKLVNGDNVRTFGSVEEYDD